MAIDPNAIVGAPELIFLSEKLMPEDMHLLREALVRKKGLTIRAHFAAMAMQGMMANPALLAGDPDIYRKVAAHALLHANALIAELNK